MVRVTVVIACRNGEPHLRETLEAVVAQQWDQPWELIFADNGSTDSSVDTFRSVAAANPHLPMIDIDASQKPGKSHALNLAVAQARGEAILICDDDDIPAPGWLRAMGEALQRHNFVSANRDDKLLNTGATGWKYRPVSFNGIATIPYPPYADCTSGATMGFTKTVFDAIGGFDLARTRAQDIDFCIRAHLKGFRLQPVPDAVLHYRLRDDLQSIYDQAYLYRKHDVQIAYLYRDTGPAQRGRWAGLLLSCAKIVPIYLIWRFRPGPRDMAKGAWIYWRMGSLAGQIDGAITYGAPPTWGWSPKPALLRSPVQQRRDCES